MNELRLQWEGGGSLMRTAQAEIPQRSCWVAAGFAGLMPTTCLYGRKSTFTTALRLKPATHWHILIGSPQIRRKSAARKGFDYSKLLF